MVKLTSTGKEALDSLFDKASQKKKIPGFVFGVSSSEGEIYFNSTGHKVIDDPSSGDITPDSVFWLCSQTKFIVHLAALQLIEQGRLTQQTPVSDFFPDFTNTIVLDDILSPSPSFKPAEIPILVKHLLNFSSGLFYPPFPDPTSNLPTTYTYSYQKEDPHAEFFRHLKGGLPGIPIKFEPGTDFAYGYSADILGFIVEKVSGKTLEQYFQENIFGPLGIKASFYRTSEITEREITLSYRRSDGQLEPWNDQIKLIERDASKVFLFLGGVGVYSSLRDYLTLLRHILQLRVGKITQGIVTPGTAHELFVPTLTEAGAKNVDLFTKTFPGGQWSVGLALCTADWPKRRKRGAAFWSGWAGTQFFIDPETGIAVVFGTQLAPSRDAEVRELFGQLEETLYNGLEA